MSNVNLAKFRAAVSRLEEYLITTKGTWEQINHKVFLEPDFVLSDFVKYGLIPVTQVVLSSNQNEVLQLRDMCVSKLTYLTQEA